MAMPATNGQLPAPDKSPPPPLPPALTKLLPAAVDIVKHAAAIEKLIPTLRRQMEASQKQGAISLARTYTVLHRMMSTIDAKLKPLDHLFEEYKTLRLPATFEQAGVTHVPLDVGYRVAVSYTWRASVKAGQRDGAYDWLRKHHPDCLIETANSSTLSKLARELSEEQNKELPERLFNAALVPGTSVTKV